MSQPHLQIRVALLKDHVAKGWLDGDMHLAYTLILQNCDWNTGIWHGSADALAALVGGQWSKSKAVRVLRRLCLARYITSHHVPKQKGNYDIAVNNYIPTIGKDKGKKIRRTKTRDYRIINEPDNGFIPDPDDDPNPTTSGSQVTLTSGSPVTRIQEGNRVLRGESGVGVRFGGESAATTTSRIADAIADAEPSSLKIENLNTNPKTSQESGSLDSEAKAPVPAIQPARPELEPASPVGDGGYAAPAPPTAPPPPDPERQAELVAFYREQCRINPAFYLAQYLWFFLHHREDVEILRLWDVFWERDFQDALDRGYSKDDIELAILASQIPACRPYYKRALPIVNNLDLLIEKGAKMRDRGVLGEEPCRCGSLFSTYYDLKQHWQTCEDSIDPADAAEEEMMYAAEDLISEGLMPDPDPMFDPFHDDREGEDLDGLYNPWAEETEQALTT
jgi:hypothetical protein